MKIKWKNNADSPVLFFVDDLCNKWIDLNDDGKMQSEEDWGYAGFDKDGAFSYLISNILNINSAVKATFFVPVRGTSSIVRVPKFQVKSNGIDYDNKSIAFFKAVAKNPNFELAYHGTTHGISGEDAKDFKQEWECFNSLDSALKSINAGKEIFRSVVGEYPAGGKYCGYISNSFSDESIDKTGFKWWCRFYNRAAVDGYDQARYGGDDKDPITAFSVKFFGNNKVVDIPTTIPGSLLSSIFKPAKGIKGVLKKILRPLLIRWKLREIDFLLKNNLIISIQEHMSPSREDEERQAPNIFDDKESLKAILKYLKKKNVWYCTGSELAEWVKGK